MAQELLLGLDVGTTFSKAAAVSTDGVERGHGSVRTPWRAVPTGAEIDPRDMAAAAAAAASTALGRAGGGRVLAIGVTSMAETGALVDGGGEPVVPSIVWYDTRGQAEAAEMGQALGANGFSSRTGLPVTALCSVAKYRWIRANWPEAKRGLRWLSVGEWIVRALGGREVADLSLASRTGFLDVVARSAWEDALSWAEAPQGFLPQPAPSGSPAGTVDRHLPWAEGAVLCVAGHDHACASVGAGAVHQGDLFDSCGTAEAFVRAVDPFLPEADVLRAVAGGVTVGWHVLPERWVLLGGFRSGLALQRILGLLGVDEEAGRMELDLAAMEVPPGAGGVRVEGVVDERAAISGIRLGDTPAQVWRAALEAIARHGAGVVSTIEEVVGKAGRVVVTGGGARSPAFRAVKRSVLGRPFEEPLVQEAGARGAALVAGIAAGVYGGFDDLPPVRWEVRDI
jgi:sugar (pentulose or hexulose) kinase